MAYISAVDNYYFQFHIVATFAEYLNNIGRYNYQTLNDISWEDRANEFIPILDDKNQNIEDTQKKLFDIVMAEFPKNFLTYNQSNELLDQVGMACQNFIKRNDFKCYCGDSDCEADCGVLDCGCIDMCRNRCGLNRY
jgi:hypothetical protein